MSSARFRLPEHPPSTSFKSSTFDQTVEWIVDMLSKKDDFVTGIICSLPPRQVTVKACEDESKSNTWEIRLGKCKLKVGTYHVWYFKCTVAATLSSYYCSRVFISFGLNADVQVTKTKTDTWPDFYIPWASFVDNITSYNNCCIRLTFHHLLEVNTGKEQPVKKPQPALECLGSRLLANPELSDLEIVAEDETTFPAHKCVLAAQSLVFKQMFQVEMKEKTERLLPLRDFRAESVKCFLAYLYCQTMETERLEIVEDLLVLAQKYDIPELKQAAENNLNALINVESVCQSLVLAGLNCSEKVKKFCIKFIIDNRASVTKSDAWQELKKNHGELYLEVLEAISVA